MQEQGALVAIVAIGCATGVFVTFINMIKAAILRRPNQEQASLVNEIRALREEVQHVRQQNNDVILSLDNQVRVLDHRLDHLEGRTLSSGNPAEHRTVGSRRG